MDDTTITALPTASGIDGAVDWLAIDRTSLGATQKINRQTFLGVSGQPMDISSSQNVTNKSLDNTNTITLKDTLFTLQDDSDTTKQARFQLSGITTATTRTYTLPNASSTLADIATSQTLTNKTLSGPVITNGSITGTTITTDAIVGQSVSTSGTIYGLAITSSKISGASITAGTGGSALLATNAVQGNQLATNTITIGHAQITTTFSTSSTTVVQVTGLTITVIIPTGGRSVKVSFYSRGLYNATANQRANVSIWDGTVGSGTQIGEGWGGFASTNSAQSGICEAVITPSPGTKTYNIGLLALASGTASVDAATTGPAFILAEVI